MTRSPARRALRAAGILAALAFVALLVYGLTTKATNSTIDDALSRGEAVPAPAFTLSSLADGRDAGAAWSRAAADGDVALRELRGTPVVLNFWASWCDNCTLEMPALQHAYEQDRARGVVFVGLAYADTPEHGKPFLQKYGVTYPSGPDASGSISVDYGVTGVPETIFIGRDGKIASKAPGGVDQSSLDAGVQGILK